MYIVYFSSLCIAFRSGFFLLKNNPNRSRSTISSRDFVSYTHYIRTLAHKYIIIRVKRRGGRVLLFRSVKTTTLFQSSLIECFRKSNDS